MNKLSRLSPFKRNGKARANGSPGEEGIPDHGTQYDSAYSGAKEALGDPQILNSCLDDVYQKFKEKCRLDKVEQQRLNAPFVEERERQRSILRECETARSNKEEDLASKISSVNSIDEDITNARSHPERFGIEASKRPRAQFFIGLSILIPIILYLVVFYISASYSAFFKTFDSTLLMAAIFDAKALSKAISDGWLEALFVCTIPFAFMGMGYLVHMFQKEKRVGKLKVLVLFLITFIFDSILAYQIEKKIYDFDKTPVSPSFDLQIAFSTVEFWAIIFAGFVVYIIFGLIFDFVMKEHENINRISVFVNRLKEEKGALKRRMEQIKSKMNDLKEEITQAEGRINELQSKIDGFIFPNRRYLLYHSEFLKGWLMAISKEFVLTPDRKSALIDECKKTALAHLESHEVSTEDHENIIYSRKTLV